MATPTMFAIGPFGGPPQSDMMKLTNASKKLKSITVSRTSDVAGGQITAIAFTYLDSNDTEVPVGPWGTPSRTDKTDTITIPAGQYVNQFYCTATRNVKSLTFITNTGDISKTFGDTDAGHKYSVPVYDHGAIVGLFASADSTVVNSVGIYVGAAHA